MSLFPLVQFVTMAQPLILMTIYMFLPLIIVVGRYSLQVMLLGALAIFTVKFWAAMYIPIVVAMAARQNVVAAARGGVLAVVAGIAGTVATFALVPVLSRGAKREGALTPAEQDEVR